MHAASGVLVGRLVGLWRYPVKSMAAQALTEVEVSWHGLVGDRRWAFVRDGTSASGFPWLTLRQRHDMNGFRPEFLQPERPDRSPTVVHCPDGARLDVTDPELARRLWADGARVIRQDRGVFDTFPISIITTQSIQRLGAMVGHELAVQRFRPNLLIEASANAPFVEDEWVGCTLRIGQLRVRVDKRDGRCAVITIDPGDGRRDPDVLRAVIGERDGTLGVYASTVVPGAIALGDAVLLERP